MTTVTTFRIGSLQRGPALSLRRTPIYLRFVVKGTDWNTLDALDQLDDVAQPDETIIVAKWCDGGTVHYDGIRNGRRFGEWRKWACYEYMKDQPADDVLRDNAKWTAWATKQHAKDEAEKVATP